jgi:hypothetical protein
MSVSRRTRWVHRTRRVVNAVTCLALLCAAPSARAQSDETTLHGFVVDDHKGPAWRDSAIRVLALTPADDSSPELAVLRNRAKAVANAARSPRAGAIAFVTLPPLNDTSRAARALRVRADSLAAAIEDEEVSTHLGGMVTSDSSRRRAKRDSAVFVLVLDNVPPGQRAGNGAHGLPTHIPRSRLIAIADSGIRAMSAPQLASGASPIPATYKSGGGPTGGNASPTASTTDRATKRAGLHHGGGGAAVSLGAFSNVYWYKPTGSLAGTNPQTTSRVVVPEQEYRVDWNLAQSVSLEFGLGASYQHQGSVSSKALAFGFQPNIYLLGHNRSHDVRVFLAPGTSYNYSSGSASGSETTPALHQFGMSGYAGIEVPLWRESRVRVGFGYEHYLQDTHDNIASQNIYGFNLGLFEDYPCEDDDYDDDEGGPLLDYVRTPLVGVRFGSEFGITNFGNQGPTSSLPNRFSIAIPAPVVGGYVALGDTRQFKISGDVAFARSSTNGFTNTQLQWQPGVEYNIRRTELTGLGFRLRGFGVLDYQSYGSSSSYGTSESAWFPGYGAEGMFTLPTWGHHLFGFGVNFTHINEKSSVGFPSQTSFNLKASWDYRLAF